MIWLILHSSILHYNPWRIEEFKLHQLFDIVYGIDAIANIGFLKYYLDILI